MQLHVFISVGGFCSRLFSDVYDIVHQICELGVASTESNPMSFGMPGATFTGCVLQQLGLHALGTWTPVARLLPRRELCGEISQVQSFFGVL